MAHGHSVDAIRSDQIRHGTREGARAREGGDKDGTMEEWRGKDEERGARATERRAPPEKGRACGLSAHRVIGIRSLAELGID